VVQVEKLNGEFVYLHYLFLGRSRASPRPWRG